MSTAFHLETDRQIEQINQTLEAYLRHYVNHQQNNQVSLLLIAQLLYNCKVLDTTGLSPFFSNYRKDTNLHLDLRIGPKAKKALVNISKIKALHKEIAEQVKTRNDKTAVHINRKRKNRPQLKEGDKVYLLTKNIKSKRPSKKLDHVKVGPFLVKQRKGLVNYKLDLPRDTNIHPVFYISLLELASDQTPLQETFHFKNKEEYEVEEILERRGQKYLIKWKGTNSSENTWEPYRNLANYRDALREFRRRGPGKLGTSRRQKQGEQFAPKRRQ